MRHARWWAGAGVVLVVVIGLCAGPAMAQTLSPVPPKTLVVLKVKNMQATSAKIAKLANDLGLAAMAPQMNDPLKALEDKAKMTQGINANGDLMMCFVDPTGMDEGAKNKAVVILVPVTDYKTFLANFADATTEGDVTEAKIASDAEDSYIADFGSGYAAVAATKELAAAKPTEPMKITAAGQKQMADKDICVYADFVALRALLQPKLADNRQNLLDRFVRDSTRSPEGQKMAPFMHAMGDEALTVADSFLRDAQAATWGVNIGDEGLSYTLMADFVPESYFGKTVQSLKTTSDPLLNGLPTGKYLVYGGFVQDPAVASKLFSDVADPMVKDMAGTDNPDADPKVLNDYVTQIKAMISGIKGARVGLLAPTGALGQEALLQEEVVWDGDANTILGAQQKMVAMAPDVFKAMGFPADTYKITYTPKAKEVDGVSFDSMVTMFNPDPNSPMAQQQAQMMNLMYGPNGATVLEGVSGDHLLFGSGLSDAQLTALIDTSKANGSPLGDVDAVKKIGQQLPAKRVAEVFVPLDQVVTTGLTYAKVFGFAVPVQLPPDLPPIGAAVSTDAATIQLDTYIPTALVQSLVAAGMQAAMQMGGGANNGGGM